MHDGNRVLTEAEWRVFSAGLDQLRDYFELDLSAEEDDADTGIYADTGIRVFDRLTAEQKLALLADVASALRDPAVPIPRHTAANEGAIMAVLVTFRDMLRNEVEINEVDATSLRQCLLAAVTDSEDRPERLPKPTSKKWDLWDTLYECIADRVFWDHDFAAGDAFLDLPPNQAKMKLRDYGIDPDYFLATPAEPDKKGLMAARQTLARLIGLPVPDDDGDYPALEDLYHGLYIGPVTPAEIAAWENNPWIQVSWDSEPGWDCDMQTWQTEFGEALPTTCFRVDPATPSASYKLPSGVRVEHSGERWVVRDEQGAYWCGLIDNYWADPPDDDTPPLIFPTELDAKAAFVQACQMYDERSERHKAASARLGIAD
jgi:hypothetical protein